MPPQKAKNPLGFESHQAGQPKTIAPRRPSGERTLMTPPEGMKTSAIKRAIATASSRKAQVEYCIARNAARPVVSRYTLVYRMPAVRQGGKRRSGIRENSAVQSTRSRLEMR